MSFQIKRTLLARNDLLEIWLTIAQDDRAAADRNLERIEVAIGGLRDFPRLGAPRDELLQGARTLLRSPYLVFYRIDDSLEEIEIIRVIDARRDLDVVFQT